MDNKSNIKRGIILTATALSVMAGLTLPAYAATMARPHMVSGHECKQGGGKVSNNVIGDNFCEGGKYDGAIINPRGPQ
jgi:hypothetical protein